MTKPELKFQLDMKFDQWTGNEFLSFKEKDIFSNSVLRDHPKLIECKTMEKDAKKEFVNTYVSEYYAHNLKTLEAAIETALKDWSSISEAYYEEVDKLFCTDDSKYDWPEGYYICFLSIFNCNPRFIKDKYFQAFFRHSETTNYVCMHEMLHFAFYDYMEKNFAHEFKDLGENGMWKLSEVFNDVILRQPGYVSISKQPDPKIYAQTQDELEKYKLIWSQNNNLNKFISEIVPSFLPPKLS